MISIIVPTYNRLESLKRCVNSIIPQAYDGLELIIIDDCSKDGTIDYLSALSKEYRFIKTIFNKVNAGVNYTRNRGIEIASEKFILFLDSDDAMTEGSLQQIESTLQANPLTKHFLFMVSDRLEESKNAALTKEIRYEDWLAENVYGDFTHVILTTIMQKYLFFEEFRMFEHLNWLRIKKETSPQLLVNVIVSDRERDRPDSLTSGSRLQNVKVISDKFDSEKMYYSLYYPDLKLYHPKFLNFRLIYAILLGIAADKKRDCKTLLNYAGKWQVKALGKMAILLPSDLVRFGIIRYSNYKQKH